MKGFARGFIAFFFYAAFAVFLLPSIPHIAYFFRSFEEAGQDHDIFWWVVAYAIAGVVDTTVLLMTWAESKLARNNRPFWSERLFVWLFIGLATALSIFANWQYSVQFASTTMLSHVNTKYPSLVDAVDPIIASLFPLFQIVYSRIADVIIGKDITAEELQKQLDEMNNKQPLLDQLASIRQQQSAQKVDGLFSLVGQVKDKATQAFGTPKQTQSVQQSAQVEAPNSEPTTDPMLPATGEVHEVPTPIAGHSMKLPEAAEYLEVTPETVLKLRSQGKVKSSGKSKTLLTRSSVVAYANSRTKRGQPSAKEATNEVAI